jgi:hypothetical protein
MTSRQLSLSRGKAGITQRFSLAHLPDAPKVLLVRSTYGTGMSEARRTQILADPNYCSQFLCRYGDSFGFLTRPIISATTTEDGGQLVVGSFSDTLGQVYPVSLPLDHFLGFFSGLVKRSDAARFNLPVYPKEPDTIQGPPPAAGGRRAVPVEPGMERLNWPLPDDPQEGDEPVIALLPNCLPVGPGQSCDHMLLLGLDDLVGDTL